MLLPISDLLPPLRPGTKLRSRRRSASPGPCPRAHSPRPPRLQSRRRSSALHPRRALRVSAARPPAPPARAPPTWQREPAPGITWRRRPALAHQSAPAERLRLDAPPNQRPQEALAPPPPARAPALRLKGPEGQFLPTAGLSSPADEPECTGPR